MLSHYRVGLADILFSGWWLKRSFFGLHGLVGYPFSRPGHQSRTLRLTMQDDATLLDRERLKNEYGIKTVMDLRTV